MPYGKCSPGNRCLKVYLRVCRNVLDVSRIFPTINSIGACRGKPVINVVENARGHTGKSITVTTRIITKLRLPRSEGDNFTV